MCHRWWSWQCHACNQKFLVWNLWQVTVNGLIFLKSIIKVWSGLTYLCLVERCYCQRSFILRIRHLVPMAFPICSLASVAWSYCWCHDELFLWQYGRTSFTATTGWGLDSKSEDGSGGWRRSRVSGRHSIAGETYAMRWMLMIVKWGVLQWGGFNGRGWDWGHQPVQRWMRLKSPSRSLAVLVVLQDVLSSPSEAYVVVGLFARYWCSIIHSWVIFCMLVY